MSVTLSVTSAYAERAALSVAISGGSVVTRLTRTDRNGTTGVRLAAGVLPISATATVYDYEYALYTGLNVTWRAWNGSTLLASVTYTPTSSGLAYLTCPRRPSLGYALNNAVGKLGGIVVRWDDTRQSPSTVHQVIGRADPVVVLQPLAARTGSMDIAQYGPAAQNSLEQALAQPEVFMLRQSDQLSLDLYFVVTGFALAHAAQDVLVHAGGPPVQVRQWTLTLSFTEVARLPGEVTLDPSWTYDAVAAEHSTYVSLLGAYSTYASLEVGG